MSEYGNKQHVLGKAFWNLFSFLSTLVKQQWSQSMSRANILIFSLIRCFSDVLIRMSESYKTVRNPTDGITKFWKKIKNFWQFYLKQLEALLYIDETQVAKCQGLTLRFPQRKATDPFKNMMRMPDFLIFLSNGQNVRKGPDQAK